MLPTAVLISPPVGETSQKKGMNAAHRRRSAQARSSKARTAATLAPSVILTRPSSEVPMFTAHVDIPWRGTMPPRGTYQALSSNARTAATLAPSVILTRPSSEVPCSHT